MTSFPLRTLAVALALAGLLCLGCTTASAPPPEPVESPKAVSDARLAAAIHIALLEQLGEDALGIETRVSGDRAVLTGEVSERSSEELAEEVALSVEGIDRVSNRLRTKGVAGAKRSKMEAVLEDAGHEVEDAALEARVGIALLEELGRHAFGVEVEATDGVVSLRGHVPDEERRELAKRTAGRINGVKKVLDLLTLRRRVDG